MAVPSPELCQCSNSLVDGVHRLHIQAHLLQLQEHTGDLRNVQAHIQQLLSVSKYLTGGAVQHETAVGQHDHTVSPCGLVHVVGDGDDRDSLLAVELFDGLQHLLAPHGIQHYKNYKKERLDL